MTLLVVASPCALVLSVPSSVLSAIACGARRGVLFRGGAAVETLAGVNVVAFDKTGTLTSGELTLESLECLRGDEARCKQVAYTLSRLSEHPLSRAIQKLGRQWRVNAAEVTQFETLPGQGLRADIGGRIFLLGNSQLAGIAPRSSPSRLRIPLGLRSGWRARTCSAGWASATRFDRKPRESCGTSPRWVANRDVDGRPRGSRQIARGVQIGEIRAGLMPEQKVAAIQALKEDGACKVAMVGDGVNDAPCLAAADVGVAMGARGSDAALEQAEVGPHERPPREFSARPGAEPSLAPDHPSEHRHSSGNGRRDDVRGFFFRFPWPSALLAHEGSTVLVVLNSLRLPFVGAG